MPLDTEARKMTLWAQNGDRATPETVGIIRSIGYGDSFSETGGDEVSRAEWNQERREFSGWALDWMRGLTMIWDTRVPYSHAAGDAAFCLRNGTLYVSTRPSQGQDPESSSAWRAY